MYKGRHQYVKEDSTREENMKEDTDAQRDIA